MIDFIVSLYVYSLVLVIAIVFYLIALILFIVTAPFDSRLRLLHLFTCLWGTIYTIIVPVFSYKYRGRRNINRKQTYVVVANHQSLVDIIVLYRLWILFRFVSKIELFKIPFIGWNMTLNRYIAIRRGSKQSAEKMLTQCEDTINQGTSVLFFPEGTRSKDNAIHNFKHGAFIMAHKVKRPILPIVISGTGQAIPTKTFFIKRSHIKVEVLKAIPYEEYSSLSVDETIELVRARMLEAYNKMVMDT